MKKVEIKRVEKERNKIITAITKYKTKFPVIDKILEAISELDNLKEKNGENSITLVDYNVIFKKHGLNPKEFAKYDKIYNDYNELMEYLNQIEVKYKNALYGKIHNDDIKRIINKKYQLETEIVLRNTKLVNGFIREKFSDLLVDTDDLFQICYAGLWKAVSLFDYKKGNKFSTFAYPCMFGEVTHSFKELTGYSWVNYWNKKKIVTLLENTSKIIGRKLSIEELVEYGFLDMKIESAKNLIGIAEERSLSDLFPIVEKSYDDYEIESQYEMYFGDDEIDDYVSGKVDEKLVNYDSKALKSMLREDLKNVLDTLTPKEELVLKLRFGLEDGIMRTLDEVGERLGLTRERIRQVEAKALRKLRHPSRSKKLLDYLDEEYSDVKIGVYKH